MKEGSFLACPSRIIATSRITPWTQTIGLTSMTRFVSLCHKLFLILLLLGSGQCSIRPGHMLKELDIARRQVQNLMVDQSTSSLEDALLLQPDILDRFLLCLRHYLALEGDLKPLFAVKVPLKTSIVSFSLEAVAGQAVSTETASNIPGYPSGEILDQTEKDGYIYLTVRTQSKRLSSFKKTGPVQLLKANQTTTMSYDQRSLSLALQAGIRVQIREEKLINYSDAGQSIDKTIFLADSTSSQAFLCRSDVAIASMEDHIEIWRAPAVGWEPYKRISQSIQKYETSIGTWITHLQVKDK